MMTVLIVSLLVVTFWGVVLLDRILKSITYRVLIELTISSTEMDEDDFPKRQLNVRKVVKLSVPPQVGMEIGDNGVDGPLKTDSVLVHEGYFVVRCKRKILLNSFRGQKIALRGNNWQGVDDGESEGMG